MPRKPRNHLKGLRVRGITPAGKNWLIQSLDPFHDTTIQPTGYPDMNSSMTLVYPFESELTITAPSTVTSGSNWDCHVFSLPELFVNNYSAVVNNAEYFNETTYGTMNTVPLGPLNVATMPAGQTTFNYSSNNVAQTTNFQTVTPPLTYLAGTSRLVGMGFEVTNTTAAINAGGAVSYYRSPQGVEASSRMISSTGSTLGPQGIEYKSRAPPNSISDTHVLLNSVKGAAIDGAYVVCTANTIENPMQEGLAAVARSFLSKANGDTANETGMVAITAATEAPSTGAITNGLVDVKPVNVDTCGAYFTNLPYNTSLTLVVRMYIEYTPTISDSSIIKYARQSPAYDLVALQCYGRAIASLPKGVKVGENPLGEWFNRVVDVIGNYGGTIGGMFGPEGAILGKAASTAAKAYQGIAKKTTTKLKSLNEKENKVARQVKTLATKVNTMAKNKATTKK